MLSVSQDSCHGNTLYLEPEYYTVYRYEGRKTMEKRISLDNTKPAFIDRPDAFLFSPHMRALRTLTENTHLTISASSMPPAPPPPPPLLHIRTHKYKHPHTLICNSGADDSLGSLISRTRHKVRFCQGSCSRTGSNTATNISECLATDGLTNPSAQRHTN